MKGLSPKALLIMSNTFVPFAFYGHLKFKNVGWVVKFGLLLTIFAG